MTVYFNELVNLCASYTRTVLLRTYVIRFSILILVAFIRAIVLTDRIHAVTEEAPNYSLRLSEENITVLTISCRHVRQLLTFGRFLRIKDEFRFLTYVNRKVFSINTMVKRLVIFDLLKFNTVFGKYKKTIHVLHKIIPRQN